MPRHSPVRAALLDLVGASARHDWSIEELAGALAQSGTPADFSTVFRAVARLEADGALRRVELGDGRARYEAAGEHHEHVRCERCGTVDAVPGCAVEVALPRVQDATGFRLTGHQLLFSGVCPDCAAGG